MLNTQHTTVQTEAVITVANGDLRAVVWKDKAGREVIYLATVATKDDILALLSKTEDVL